MINVSNHFGRTSRVLWACLIVEDASDVRKPQIQHEEQGSAYALEYLRQGGGRAFVLGQVGGWEACRVWKGN